MKETEWEEWRLHIDHIIAPNKRLTIPLFWIGKHDGIMTECTTGRRITRLF